MNTGVTPPTSRKVDATDLTAAATATATATALQAGYDRSKSATTRRNSAPPYDEMNALHTFVELHSFQVKQLGRAEFLRAIASAVASGKAQGNAVSVVKDLAALE